MADTYFEAMIKIREALELNSEQLICKGACESVYPSAMILNMGEGRRAYSLKLGKQARLTDLVDIFGECNADECTSIEQQERFFYEWAMSPKE